MLISINTSDLNKFKSGSINKKLNIIALDNEVATLTALNLLIKTMGHKITVFSSPSEALDCLKDNNFDIALIDYRIPGQFNGINIVNKIAKMNSTTRCFLVTGDHDIENQNSIAIVNKPLTIKKLEQIFNLF